jgi:hypothetical protein
MEVLMIQWPARCASCGQEIDDWSDAGLYNKDFLHKHCWTELYRQARDKGRDVADLRSPVERSTQLELPMFVFLMLFHFGLAAAVGGWFLLTQTDESRTAGYITLVIGLLAPLAGAVGAFVNILSRRRIELIRHSLDLQGGWKPGR